MVGRGVTAIFTATSRSLHLITCVSVELIVLLPLVRLMTIELPAGGAPKPLPVTASAENVAFVRSTSTDGAYATGTFCSRPSRFAVYWANHTSPVAGSTSSEAPLKAGLLSNSDSGGSSEMRETAWFTMPSVVVGTVPVPPSSENHNRPSRSRAMPIGVLSTAAGGDVAFGTHDPFASTHAFGIWSCEKIGEAPKR